MQEMRLSFLVLIQLVIFCCLKHLKDRMFHFQIGKSVEFAIFHFFVFENFLILLGWLNFLNCTTFLVKTNKVEILPNRLKSIVAKSKIQSVMAALLQSINPTESFIIIIFPKISFFIIEVLNNSFQFFRSAFCSVPLRKNPNPIGLQSLTQ